MKRSLYTASVLLTLGSLIYFTLRQNVLFLEPLAGTKLLESVKLDITYNGNVFVYLLLFCLADSLWYAALLVLQWSFYGLIFCSDSSIHALSVREQERNLNQIINVRTRSGRKTKKSWQQQSHSINLTIRAITKARKTESTAKWEATPIMDGITITHIIASSSTILAKRHR